jgi:hypothetical protein
MTQIFRWFGLTSLHLQAKITIRNSLSKDGVQRVVGKKPLKTQN